MLAFAPILAAVQANCHLSDARHAQDLTLCNYLLAMREYYRWENDLALDAVPPRAEVARWIAEREALWDGLAEADWSPLPLASGKADLATEVWITSVRRLAVCIASMINVLSPECVVLSGGITQADEALLNPLNNFLDQYEWRPGGKKAPVKFARFSDRAGAIGAAGFDLSKMK